MMEVELPDGTIAEFPDGTAPDVIKGVLQKRFGSPAQPAPQQPSGWTAQKEADKVEQISGTSAFSDATGGIIQGIPFGDEMVSALGALPRAATEWARGDGFHPMRAYDRQMQVEEELRKRREERSPIASTVGSVAGGLGVGGVMAKGGVSLLQGAKPTIASMVGRGAAEGTAYGAAYGAGEGRGVEDRFYNMLRGAGVGGAVGGALPLVAGGVGKAAGMIKDRQFAGQTAAAAGTNRKALEHIRRALADDGMDTAAASTRLNELGPEGMLADLGPNLQRQAGAIAATPGRGQQIVREALFNRADGATGRITSALDQNLGPSPIPSQVDDAIRAGKQALSPQYEAAFGNSRAVDTSRLALDMEAMAVQERGRAAQVAKEVRDMLSIRGVADELDPDPRTLHAVRRAIDGMLKSEADPNARRVLGAARKQVDDTLTTAVPGIKSLDAQYADLSQQGEAFKRGQSTLDSGRTSPRPAELAQEFGAASPTVQKQLSAGARAEIDRIVGTNANDVVALNRLVKGEGDWNRARLATLFGQDKADEIIRVLDAENAFRRTHGVVTQNSETAARLAAQSDLAGGPVANLSATDVVKVGGLSGAARAVALKPVEMIANAFQKASLNKNSEALAKALTTPQGNQAILQALARLQRGRPKNTDLQKAIAGALLRSGAQQLPGYIAP